MFLAFQFNDSQFFKLCSLGVLNLVIENYTHIYIFFLLEICLRNFFFS